MIMLVSSKAVLVGCGKCGRRLSYPGPRRRQPATMRRDLRQLTESIREGKVTERKKALEDLATWFRMPQNVAKIGNSNDEWIEIFETLCVSAKAEHDAVGKKVNSAATAQTKLENISAAFRVVVESSIPYLNNASLEYLVPRLVAIMKFTNALVDATGSNYARTLLSVVSHPSHIRSFTDKTWHTVSRLAWAVLLNDRLSDKHNWSEEDPKSMPRATGPASPVKAVRASSIQLIFATIIRHLCASPFSPLVERERSIDDTSDELNWACYLLVKFCRYFEMYQGSVTSHVDMIPSLCHVLEQVELNRVRDMMWFSRRVWPLLVSLMKGRVRTDYVQLLVVFKFILPYYVRVENDDARADAATDIIDSNSFKGLTDLVLVIDEYAPLKAGLESLSIESLRLEFTPADEDLFTGFRAKTFIHGRAFTASQAHAWTILELQADCTFYLYRQEETTPQSQFSYDGPPTKRRRSENALEILLNGLKNHSSPTQGLFRLQVLLFLIDRRWDYLDVTHQQLVLNALFRLTAVDDATDAFALLCLASVAAASNKVPGSPVTVGVFWANIWVHAYRRLSSTSSQVSRAASHILHGLMKWNRVDSSVISQHIAQFSRDFREDEENVSYDHSTGFEGLQAGLSSNEQTIAIHAMTESSCALLAQFIAFADGDAALCRLQLEDSVRKWIRKCLYRIISADRSGRGSITTGRGNKDSERLRRSAQRLDAHINSQDILSVLQAVCGLSIRPTLKCDTRLPEDDLVRAVLAYESDRTLRQYVLQAIVPGFVIGGHDSTRWKSNNTANSQADSVYDGEFSSLPGFVVGDIAPSARETKTLTMLEDLTRKIVIHGSSDARVAPDNSSTTPMSISSSAMLEKSILAIKLSTSVLGLQASLEANSTRPSRDLYSLAFTAFQSVVPWNSQDHKKYDWSAHHWTEIMCELRPLTWMEDPLVDPWHRQIEQFLTRPGNGSGIKRELARQLAPDPIDSRRKAENDRSRILIQFVWSQKAASDCLSVVNESLRALLQLFSDRLSQGLDVEYDRTGENPFSMADADKLSAAPSATADAYFASVSIAYIATSSALSRNTINSQPDPDLEHLVLQSEGRAFLMLGQAFCHCVRAGTLHASPATAKDILTTLNRKLKTWELWRSESMHVLVFQFLDVLSPVWLNESGELKAVVQKLFPRWALKKVMDGGSWKSRRALTGFLGKHSTLERFHRWWGEVNADNAMDVDGDGDSSQDEDSPLEILGELLRDGDIRVRSCSSIFYAIIFVHAGVLSQDSMVLYLNMSKKIPSDPVWYEGMLSRFIALTNTMIVSSPVRRGVYWHLLEVTLDEPHFTQHLISLLMGLAARLGLAGPHELFHAYCTQIAIQAVAKGADFLQLPPKVLGFRTHKECADSTLTMMLPVTIISTYVRSRGPDVVRPSVLDDDFFSRYCKATHREPKDALRECFSQLIAGSIIADHQSDVPPKSRSGPLRDWITQCARECDANVDPGEFIRLRADGIAAAILCYGGDLDYHPEGSIVQALRQTGGLHSDMIVETFRKLHQFRQFDDFPMHTVNLPGANTSEAIKSLTWFTRTFVVDLDDDLGASTIYHTIHHLFSAVHATPLVNEQLRSIHSLTYWLSVSTGILDRPPMIHTILTHSIALLSQEDLTHSAQSIITWILERARHAEKPEEICQVIAIGALISRIAELSVQFSRSTDPRTSSMGLKLLEWIEHELQRLCEVKGFREELQAAVTLWPRHLYVSSQGFNSEDPTEGAARVLAREDTSPVGRFRIVRQLNNIPMYATGTFAREHFWTLKESIPADDLLMQEDLGAFMELLYKGSGKFHSIRIDAPEEDGLACRHRSQSEESVKRLTVMWMFGQTTSATAGELYAIHDGLRRLCHPACGVPITPDDMMLSIFRSGAREPLQVVEVDASFLKKPASREAASKYGKWLCDMTVFLTQLLSRVDVFYAQLHPLLATNATFAANLLPILVHQILVNDIEEFFGSPVRPILSQYFVSIIRSDTADIAVLQAIVDLVLHLRHFEAPGDDPLGYDKWLDLNFLDLCKTSLRCGAYTTSLLFLELAAEYRDEDKVICGAHDAWELEMETVLYEIYRHVDEPDGFYAIEGRDIRKHLLQKFHHEDKWDKAFQSHVSQFEVAQGSGKSPSDKQQSLSGVVESLHSYGFSHLAMSLARDSSAGSSTDFIYSLAWRTDAWDLPQAFNPDSRNASLYGVIRAVHRGKDMESTKVLCETAARREMQNLHTVNPENVVEIRNAVQNLLCLREIRHWVQDWRQLHSQPLSPSSKRFQQYFSLSPDLDFSAAECIVATRISLIQCLIQSISSNQIGSMEATSISGLIELETRCLVELAANARRSNMPQVAFNAVSRAQQMSPKASFHISTEFAEALWTQQEHAMAIQFLTKLIRQKFPPQGSDGLSTMNKDMGLEEVQEWAQLYARLGSWTTAACFANPQDIRTQWFDPGVQLLDPLDQLRRRTAKMVYYQYASFANQQLRQMEDSDDYKRQKQWYKKVEAEIAELERSISMARSHSEKEDFRHRKTKAQRFLDVDEKSLKEHESAVKSFLEQAISMYAHYMEVSNDLDQEIAVRFCGLWFSHFDNEVAAESVRHALSKISSHKLLFLSHQLTARLGSSTDSKRRGERFLRQLVEAMCLTHPYHSLLQVLSMRGLPPSARDSLEEKSLNEASSKRREEAKRIIESVRVKVKDGSIRRPDRFMELMEESFMAYIEWAQHPIKQINPKHGGFYPIPKSIALYKWTWDGRSKVNKPPKSCIPVVTAEILIEMDGKYLDIPTIHWYERRYTVAGGVHIPKINLCVDSFGRQHRQLFKGEGGDDLRQDAVMEQVFELVNIMLAQDRESKRRELSLRTYKVIPLPRQTGLLQFIDNTETMSTWLPKAHAKYRPNDMPLKDTQTLLKQQVRNANLEERVKVFQRICREFRPVLRHFFTENNKQPVVWYAKRLTYSRSAATCSIVGHILGLGDRHISNLLMDARTGEMIHIDLGIAFDQGKYLPIPELVPFRLTADVVDGMGISGTEGIYRKCSEQTLRVLREGSDIIKTVLEVFKYDPLYIWTATPDKLRRVQDGDAESVEQLVKPPLGSEQVLQGADRAINSVSRKLDTALSVEYTVNELINAARNPANLCRIFHGWSPQC